MDGAKALSMYQNVAQQGVIYFVGYLNRYFARDTLQAFQVYLHHNSILDREMDSRVVPVTK